MRGRSLDPFFVRVEMEYAVGTAKTICVLWLGGKL
jgi:hypothetical protein